MAMPTEADFGLFRRPARQRFRQQRREALGILLPDQLRGAIERLLGLAQFAGLIGFARRIDGVENIVASDRRSGNRGE